MEGPRVPGGDAREAESHFRQGRRGREAPREPGAAQDGGNGARSARVTGLSTPKAMTPPRLEPVKARARRANTSGTSGLCIGTLRRGGILVKTSVARHCHTGTDSADGEATGRTCAPRSKGVRRPLEPFQQRRDRAASLPARPAPRRARRATPRPKGLLRPRNRDTLASLASGRLQGDIPRGCGDGIAYPSVARVADEGSLEVCPRQGAGL